MLWGLQSFSQSKTEVADNSWYHDDAHEYVLSSAEQLLGLSELVAGGINFANKTIYIGTDINVSSYVWQPIGTVSNPFSGILDGSGCTVSIGKIHPGELGGMFGCLSAGTVRNLSVAITEEQEAVKTIGAVAALADGQSVITFCRHVQPLLAKDAMTVGGIVGVLNGKVETCHNSGELINKNESENTVGGIAGISSGVIIGSYNEASILGTNICGGIIGGKKEMHGSLKIQGCCNEGKIYARSHNEKETDAIVGGIGGVVNNVDMMECYNVALISSYCYKNRNKDVSYYAYSGGLIGMGYGNISTSYNVGDVVSRCVVEVPESMDGLAYVYSGGLIGYNWGNVVSMLSYTYNSGYVHAFGQGRNGTFLNYGGIVGDFALFMPQMKCSYFIADHCLAEGGGAGISLLNKNAGIQLSKEQLQAPSFLFSENKNVSGLNDHNSFAPDKAEGNKGFPVFFKVQTVGFVRTVDNGFLLKGKTEIFSSQKGFYYWIAGLEDYVAEIAANADFEYELKDLQKGQDYFFQAFVRMKDGTVLKGEVVKFHIPD